MPWSERQREMLRAMGVRLFDAIRSSAPAASFVEPAATLDPAAPNAIAHPLAAPVPRQVRAPAATTGAERARPDVAALGWPELRAAVAACRACPLAESRQQTVFGVGHARAHWMVIGEAPGEQEDRHGEPFVGPAGQLLDNMLRALGLTRDEAGPERQVFIANTLKCRPPKNRNPDPSETACCAPYLARQIALVQPRIILAMGRFAAQALLASAEPLGKLRGRVHDWRGVPVVVTYHPAYLLRTPTDKARAWEDLCLAASVVQAP